MAEIKVPIKIDGFKCVEDMAQAVLNYMYKGKTLKEWADSISEPKTNADRIRAMTDEELAMFIDDVQKYNIVCRPILCNDCADCMSDLCWQCWREWLKQSAKEGE